MSKIAASILKYETTIDSCKCPDHWYRDRVCKHMLVVYDSAEIEAAQSQAYRNRGGLNPSEFIKIR